MNVFRWLEDRALLGIAWVLGLDAEPSANADEAWRRCARAWSSVALNLCLIIGILLMSIMIVSWWSTLLLLAAVPFGIGAIRNAGQAFAYRDEAQGMTLRYEMISRPRGRSED